VGPPLRAGFHTAAYDLKFFHCALVFVRLVFPGVSIRVFSWARVIDDVLVRTFARVQWWWVLNGRHCVLVLHGWFLSGRAQ
jgi:hypothetical protein